MKKFEEIKDLVVVVDMINGFVYEGNMKDEYIAHIIPGIKELIKKYIGRLDAEIFFIRDAHKENSTEFKKFPLHCIDGTSESEVVDELKVYEDKGRTYKKNSTSAMFAKGLLEDVKKMKNLERVYVVGCCSDICVTNFAIPLVNYLDEHDMGVDVITVSNLIETYDAPYHPRDEYNEMANKLMKQAGVKLTTSKELGLEVKNNVRK